MVFATMRSAALALVFASASGPALAQGTPPAWQHNSTTGAAPTDIPNPPVVRHIPSPQDAAKFNKEADADDSKPTMAHALALTDEQRRFIASSIGSKGGQASGQPDFKPEIAALMPRSAKPQDLPGEVSARIPWVAPYKYALVEDKILLVDPVNDYIVLEILNR